MKKNLPVIIFIIVILILSIFIYTKKQNNITKKFYLDNKYYNQESFIKVNDLSQLKNENYILFTYNNYCTLPISCETIFEEFTKKNKIAIISIPFEEFKKTYIYKEVKYAPSIVIINNGKIVTYLDANSDNDLSKYQDVSEFEKWISKYIYFTN